MKKPTRILTTAALTLGLSAALVPGALAQESGDTSSQQLSNDLYIAGSTWLTHSDDPVAGSINGSAQGVIDVFFCGFETIFGTEPRREAACG